MSHQDQVTPSRDTAGFRSLFNDTYPKMVAYARRRVAPADVDDVVAEIYTVAWRHWRSVDTTRPLLPWLYGIAGNVVRNARRSAGRHLRLVERLEAESAVSAPAIVPAADGDGETLRQALGQLSFDDQEVLRLATWEGLAHRDIAEALGCSVNAVGIRVHRARERLKAQLDATNTAPQSDTDQ
jgi:RNA polymerase sigma-70 factor (ECF subfamily)